MKGVKIERHKCFNSLPPSAPGTLFTVDDLLMVIVARRTGKQNEEILLYAFLICSVVSQV